MADQQTTPASTDKPANDVEALIKSLGLEPEAANALLSQFRETSEQLAEAQQKLSRATATRPRAELEVLAKRAMDPNNTDGKFAVSARNLAAVNWVNGTPWLLDRTADAFERNPGVTVDRSKFKLQPAHIQYDIWVYNQDAVKKMAAEIKAQRKAAGDTETDADNDDVAETDTDEGASTEAEVEATTEQVGAEAKSEGSEPEGNSEQNFVGDDDE